MRKSLPKALFAALMIGGAAIAGATPARADDWGLSVDFGAPGSDGYYDDGRPCWWYRSYDLPAPRRCYSYFYGIWRSSLYLDGDFIFRDRDDWWRWHDRDDYRHWRDHDFHWRRDDRRGAHDAWRNEQSHDWGGSRATWSGGSNWGGRGDWHNDNHNHAQSHGAVNWNRDHSGGWNDGGSNWSGRNNGGNWHGDRQSDEGGRRGNWGHENHGESHQNGNEHHR